MSSLHSQAHFVAVASIIGMQTTFGLLQSFEAMQIVSQFVTRLMARQEMEPAEQFRSTPRQVALAIAHCSIRITVARYCTYLVGHMGFLKELAIATTFHLDNLVAASSIVVVVALDKFESYPKNPSATGHHMDKLAKVNSVHT